MYHRWHKCVRVRVRVRVRVCVDFQCDHSSNGGAPPATYDVCIAVNVVTPNDDMLCPSSLQIYP